MENERCCSGSSSLNGKMRIGALFDLIIYPQQYISYASCFRKTTERAHFLNKRGNVVIDGWDCRNSSELSSASRIFCTRSQFPTNSTIPVFRLINTRGYSFFPPLRSKNKITVHKPTCVSKESNSNIMILRICSLNYAIRNVIL